MKAIQLGSPVLVLTLAACICMLIDVVPIARRRVVAGTVAIAGVAIATIALVAVLGKPGTALGGALVVDGYALFFQSLFLLVGFLVVCSALSSGDYPATSSGELYGLVLASVVGMMLIASSWDLLTIYVSLELLSVTIYVLAGFIRGDKRSAEAALKYLLLGAFSSAIILYGIVLVLGTTGTLSLVDMAGALNVDAASGVAAGADLGLVFILAGFAFKVAVVPFQMWAPDVYEGSPAAIAALLTAGSKAAGFAALLRILSVVFTPHTLFADGPFSWTLLLAIVSALTMTFGNVAALRQDNIKRMLGYSSIAQAGYILVGVAAFSPSGVSSAIFFLVAYALPGVGSFAAAVLVTNLTKGTSIADFAGLSRKDPLAALGLSLCLLSLAGIPPLAGFWAKVYIFQSGVANHLAWLVVIGVLNSALSLYYYLRFVRQMYLVEPSPTSDALTGVPNIAGRATVVVAALGIIALGVMPQPVLTAATLAARALGLL